MKRKFPLQLSRIPLEDISNVHMVAAVAKAGQLYNAEVDAND